MDKYKTNITKGGNGELASVPKSAQDAGNTAA